MANAFSEINHDLQVVWDASSLKAVQFCPRYYQYNNLLGWKTESTDLAFGRYIASGLERYQKARLDGKTREEAILITLREALAETWFEPKGSCTLGVGCDEYGICYANAHDQPDKCGAQMATQWGGRYETLWKCNGDKPYKNEKGNRAKCPFAHERAWFPDEAPDVCGICGGSIRTERKYMPDHSTKNRQSLVRALIWYGLDQPEALEDSFRPYKFPNGQPAVELSGRLPLPLTSYTDEQYALAYNIDYIGQWGEELFITDNKTTKKSLNEEYFQTYSPDTQFDTYDVIGSVAYPDLEIRGVMVEAIQLTVSGVEFGKHPYYKTEEQREEHFKDLLGWIAQAESYARLNYWPMNKRNCWLCPFNKVCSLSPSQRDAYLKSNFTKGERWNPAHQR